MGLRIEKVLVSVVRIVSTWLRCGNVLIGGRRLDCEVVVVLIWECMGEDPDALHVNMTSLVSIAGNDDEGRYEDCGSTQLRRSEL